MIRLPILVPSYLTTPTSIAYGDPTQRRKIKSLAVHTRSKSKKLNLKCPTCHRILEFSTHQFSYHYEALECDNCVKEIPIDKP